MPTALSIDRCWLSRPLRACLQEHSDQWFALETGGLLAGYLNGADAVVCAIIGPGPDAIHEARHFTPDHAYQVEEMARIYRKSGGRHSYLGDWHTHPHGPASLSELDVRTMRTIAGDRRARCVNPLMLLLARGPGEWQVNVFALSRQAWYRRRFAQAIPLRLFDL